MNATVVEIKDRWTTILDERGEYHHLLSWQLARPVKLGDKGILEYRTNASPTCSGLWHFRTEI